MDSSLHLIPGRYKLPTASGVSLRKDSPGWEKAENSRKTATSGLPACVCVCVCVFALFLSQCFQFSVPLIIHFFLVLKFYLALSFTCASALPLNLIIHQVPPYLSCSSILIFMMVVNLLSL